MKWEQWSRSMLDHRRPLYPQPTEVEPKLQRLGGIKAVVFDIYGTLIVSGSGDVGSADAREREEVMADAFAAANLPFEKPSRLNREVLHQVIREKNKARVSDACPSPEVDIVDVWRITLARSDCPSLSTEAVHRLAVEYECRANPTWPMPNASDVLRRLSDKGYRLGIVSNAQCFTMPLIEEIAGRFGVDSVFDLNLCVFSCRYRQAKPSPLLFDVLCGSLRRAGILPSQAIYVGNDRLNDIWSAHRAGMRTAWFAGDRRSLRPREQDPRVDSLPDDLIITQLDQLTECLGQD